MTNINTRISEVTVYSDRALITRRGQVTLIGDESELVITELPLTLQPESVRVRGAGTVDVKLLDVRIENIFDSETFNEKATHLSRQIRQLELQKRTIQDQLATLYLQRNFVEGLSEKSLERYSGALATPQLNLGEIGELLSFLGQQYGEYANAIALREKQMREIDKQGEICIHQLKQIQKPTAKEAYTKYSIIVAIEPTGAGEFELELSYLVDRVVWTPVYDLRSSNSSHQVHLTYLAEVRQKTGEDWTNVKLTLSTAKPALNLLPTKLEPWYISAKRNDLFGSISLPDNEDDFAELEALLSEDNDRAKTPTLPPIDRGDKFNGTVSFPIKQSSNILSDSAAYKVSIASENYPCQTEFVTIPKLHGLSYLEATVKNTSNLFLLPGKITIFRDNVLVGSTQLETVLPGNKFKVNLGYEEGLQIDRKLVEREVEANGRSRRVTYGYKLVITNLRSKKTTLRVIEQLPVSRDEEVKVQLLSTRPEIQLGTMGELEWLLAIPRRAKGAGKQELYYQYTIEYPAEITVLSLDI